MTEIKHFNMLEHARRVLEIEAEAVRSLAQRLDENFEKAVELLFTCKRVVVTGMGKAGHIAKKVASTFASTGTPALFMHPAEGVHGDLGMITSENVVMAISNNGMTEEVLNLIPYFSMYKIPLIAMTGNLASDLARQADVVLDVHVEREACPLGLAPTSSTTAALAMGDALALVLLEKRGFKEENYAIFHPGGSLGRRLLIKVSDLMHSKEANPVIDQDKSLKEGIFEITSKALGASNIVDRDGTLVGILTDGDLRRILQSGRVDLNVRLRDIIQKMPRRLNVPVLTISPDTLGVNAIDLMEQNNITVLPVVDEKSRPIGMIHLHDLIKAGITP